MKHRSQIGERRTFADFDRLNAAGDKTMRTVNIDNPLNKLGKRCPECRGINEDFQDGAGYCPTCKGGVSTLHLPQFCSGNPDYLDCHNIGYCRRDRSCDD